MITKTNANKSLSSMKLGIWGRITREYSLRDRADIIVEMNKGLSSRLTFPITETIRFNLRKICP